jgi:HD-like signal output (HDOD) protein
MIFSSMPLTEHQIKRQIESCPRLGSLRKINSTFKDLARADQDYTGQIAEVIRRDPSLTSRLLQMVNSVFYALNQTVNSVEDAVFYLGTKQIRQMALATPVLEDLQQFTSNTTQVDWLHFWQQSIGCAVMTRELLSFANLETQGDSDYISGLVHGVGYLIANHAFPEAMSKIFSERPRSEAEFSEMQESIIGWDSAKISGHYLEYHNIPDAIRIPVAFQNSPEKAGEYRFGASAIYVAKRMIASASSAQDPSQSAEPEPSPNSHSRLYRIPMPTIPHWEVCPEFHTLVGTNGLNAADSAQSLRYTLTQLPEMLRGLV